MSHGRLIHHDLMPSTDLGSIPVEELAAELLSRLRGSRPDGSTAATGRLVRLLDALRDTTSEWSEVVENRRSVTHVAQLFGYLGTCCRRFGIDLRGGTHVDIGCGSVNPYGRMFVHLLAGARRGICIDLDQPVDEDASVRALARLASAALATPSALFGDLPVRAAEVLANLDGFDLERMGRGDATGIDAGRLSFLARPIEATGLPAASVDLVTSHSVFEHLPDVDAVLAELARITRPGGFGAHGIDTRDHRWYSDPQLHPFEFLTLPPGERIVHGCNRLRLFEYRERFEQNGFEVIDHVLYEPVSIPVEFRQRLQEPWRSQPDELLQHSWAYALVRRR